MNYSLEGYMDDMKAGLQVLFEIAHEKVTLGVDYVRNYDYDGLKLKALITYSRIQKNVTKKCVQIYENNEPVKNITDLFCYNFTFIKSFLLRRKTEPFNKNWIHVCSLSKTFYNYKNFFVHYGDVYEFMDYDDKSSLLEDFYHDISSLVKEDYSFIEFLLVVKNEDKYVHRIIYKKKLNFVRNVTDEPSEIKFLSIEYNTPYLKEPIVLELKKGDYLIHNEILSCTFVKRLLQHQVNIHTFDTDYVLTIMDNSLRTFQMRNGQYLVLQKSEYDIVDM